MCLRSHADLLYFFIISRAGFEPAFPSVKLGVLPLDEHDSIVVFDAVSTNPQ